MCVGCYMHSPETSLSVHLQGGGFFLPRCVYSAVQYLFRSYVGRARARASGRTGSVPHGVVWRGAGPWVWVSGSRRYDVSVGHGDG